LSIVGLFLWAAHAPAVEKQQSPSLAFTHVNVIDTIAGLTKPDMTVIVRKGHIIQVDNAGDVEIPKDTEVVDCVGKYIIPGLWDMHTHWYETEYLPLFIANGITGIRLMSGAPIHFNWIREIKAGRLIGPRIVEASRILDGPNSVWPGSVVVTNKEQARQTVGHAKNGGVDFIKVYSGLSREAYFAIADECKKQNIPFVGHVPYVLLTSEASDAGQKSIEHLLAIVRGCAKHEDDLRQTLPKDKRSYDRVFEQGLDSYDSEKAKRLYETFLRNGTWLCPTMTLSRGRFLIHTESISADSRLDHVPRFLRQQWEDSRAGLIRQRAEQGWSSGEEVYKKCLKFVGSLRNSGLERQILAGTDTGNPYCLPGYSLHDELELLVQSGFTAAEALRASTCNAARFLGREASLGTVEKGKLAELVLLEADPLEDIRNTTRIAGVVFDGKLYSKPELQEMLAKIKAIAQK
jgi:hypothetical protein